MARHVTIFTVAAAIGIMCSAHAAQAQAVPDLNARKQDAFISLYVRTRTCMRTAGTAADRHLTDDPRQAQLFMVTVCADPMRVQLQMDGLTEEQARRTLARLARTTYYEDVLRVPEPQAPN